MDEYKFEKGIRYEVFVGIKDKDSYMEHLDVSDFKRILTEICTEKKISFSLIKHGHRVLLCLKCGHTGYCIDIFTGNPGNTETNI